MLNRNHTQLTAQKLQIQPLFNKADSKNKLLRLVAGGGSEQLAKLPSPWDKYELMLESHTMVVIKQVDYSIVTSNLAMLA
jgi:dynein heavy chain 2